MKLILRILLLLSVITSATVLLPAQEWLSRAVLDVEQTKNKLDSRIQSPDPQKYENVRDGKDWLNPYLVIRPEGVELIWKMTSVERKVMSRNELKRMLISLPVEAWPYGRVIGGQEIGIRSGTPNSEIWRKDEKLIEKNRLEANKILASLGIKINWWPSN